MERAVQEIDQGLIVLKEKATQLVAEVQQLLKHMKVQKLNPEDASEKRPKALWVHLKEQPGYNTLSIVWSRVVYFHQQSKRPFYKDIPRGRGYRILQGKFMAYARGYHPEVQEGLWNYEMAFGEIRRLQSFLSQAKSLLRQYQKAAGPI